MLKIVEFVRNCFIVKKLEGERTRLCGSCERCMTPYKEEFKYCVAMQWNIRRDNSLMF